MDHLEELPDKYVACRELGHAWEWSTDNHAVIKDGRRVVGIDRTLLCLRCQSTRTEVLSLTGERSHASYSYAEGYLHNPGQGRVLRSDVRQEMLRRILK